MTFLPNLLLSVRNLWFLGGWCRRGYMCRIDFECELGMAQGGNTVYPSEANLLENRRCAKNCGVVEVEVRLRRVVDWGQDDH